MTRLKFKHKVILVMHQKKILLKIWIDLGSKHGKVDQKVHPPKSKC
jgi:hypothetical protein